MPKMRWTPPGPRSQRVIFRPEYLFAPPSWVAEVRDEDVDELLTYPGETFVLVDPAPQDGGSEIESDGYAETPEVVAFDDVVSVDHGE